MCCRATARVHPKNGLHIEDPFVHRLTDDSHQVAFINLSIQRPPLRANLIPWWSRKTTLRPLPSLPCTASIRLVSLCQRSAVSTKPIYCRICLITGRPLFLPRFAKQQTLQREGEEGGGSTSEIGSRNCVDTYAIKGREPRRTDTATANPNVL